MWFWGIFINFVFTRTLKGHHMKMVKIIAVILVFFLWLMFVCMSVWCKPFKPWALVVCDPCRLVVSKQVKISYFQLVGGQRSECLKCRSLYKVGGFLPHISTTLLEDAKAVKFCEGELLSLFKQILHRLDWPASNIWCVLEHVKVVKSGFEVV